MQKISAVIFDMDGLMFDTEILYFKAHAELTEKRGKKYTEDLHARLTGKKAIHVVEGFLTELEIDEDPETILEERNNDFITLLETRAETMHGLLPFLDLLEKHGVRKAIATSSSRTWVSILLNRFGIADRFEVIVTGDEVTHGKPHPEIYLKALEHLGLKGSECLVLEDAPHGVTAGKAAGCHVGAIPSQFTRGRDFSSADYHFESLADSELEKIVTS